MNNEIAQQQALAALREELSLPPEELVKLLADRKRLTERVEELNTRAVICIGSERWEQALVFLEAAQQLLESAAVRGHLTDRCLVQCILHNEASCYQNLWQLDKCSNYIEALIFNLNSRRNSAPLSPNAAFTRQGKLGLAEYYLQFCAINSQLSNHSGALISARKALHLIRGELRDWRKQLLEIRRPKGQTQEKIRLLHLVCRFNDNINLNLAQTLAQAASYYLKNWRLSMTNNKSILKDAKDLIEDFNIKSVMALGQMTLADCIEKYENQPQMNLVDIYAHILILSTCYFTIATQLRLISLKKSRQGNVQKIQQPEYKQSEIYHLLSILLLALTLSSSSPFMSHLLLSFQNHYGKNLVEQEMPFRKIFAEIIFIKQQRNLEPSIEISQHSDGLVSHLSKGSGTIIRKTKGSKEQERENKFSLIDPPKIKKSKLKHTKTKESKSKKQITSSKPKHPRQSLSKSPNIKSGSKESIIIKSQKSKQSLYQRSPIPSIKLIANPSKTKSPHLNTKIHQRQKANLKSKRKTKLQQNGNEYFLIRKGQQKKPKKTSVSSKKNISQPRSTGRLPIDSTLQTKENQLLKERKKTTKKSILQHYL